MVGVFYFSLFPGKGRQPIALPSGKVIYIRTEELPISDVSEALSLAIPLADESVMNTHLLES